MSVRRNKSLKFEVFNFLSSTQKKIKFIPKFSNHIRFTSKILFAVMNYNTLNEFLKKNNFIKLLRHSSKNIRLFLSRYKKNAYNWFIFTKNKDKSELIVKLYQFLNKRKKLKITNRKNKFSSKFLNKRKKSFKVNWNCIYVVYYINFWSEQPCLPDLTVSSYKKKTWNILKYYLKFLFSNSKFNKISNFIPQLSREKNLFICLFLSKKQQIKFKNLIFIFFIMYNYFNNSDLIYKQIGFCFFELYQLFKKDVKISINLLLFKKLKNFYIILNKNTILSYILQIDFVHSFLNQPTFVLIPFFNKTNYAKFRFYLSYISKRYIRRYFKFFKGFIENFNFVDTYFYLRFNREIYKRLSCLIFPHYAVDFRNMDSKRNKNILRSVINNTRVISYNYSKKYCLLLKSDLDVRFFEFLWDLIDILGSNFTYFFKKKSMDDFRYNNVNLLTFFQYNKFIWKIRKNRNKRSTIRDLYNIRKDVINFFLGYLNRYNMGNPLKSKFTYLLLNAANVYTFLILQDYELLSFVNNIESLLLRKNVYLVYPFTSKQLQHFYIIDHKENKSNIHEDEDYLLDEVTNSTSLYPEKIDVNITTEKIEEFSLLPKTLFEYLEETSLLYFIKKYSITNIFFFLKKNKIFKKKKHFYFKQYKQYKTKFLILKKNKSFLTKIKSILHLGLFFNTKLFDSLAYLKLKKYIYSIFNIWLRKYYKYVVKKSLLTFRNKRKFMFKLRSFFEFTNNKQHYQYILFNKLRSINDDTEPAYKFFLGSLFTFYEVNSRFEKEIKLSDNRFWIDRRDYAKLRFVRYFYIFSQGVLSRSNKRVGYDILGLEHCCFKFLSLLLTNFKKSLVLLNSFEEQILPITRHKIQKTTYCLYKNKPKVKNNFSYLIKPIDQGNIYFNLTLWIMYRTFTFIFNKKNDNFFINSVVGNKVIYKTSINCGQILNLNNDRTFRKRNKRNALRLATYFINNTYIPLKKEYHRRFDIKLQCNEIKFFIRKQYYNPRSLLKLFISKNITNYKYKYLRNRYYFRRFKLKKKRNRIWYQKYNYFVKEHTYNIVRFSYSGYSQYGGVRAKKEKLRRQRRRRKYRGKTFSFTNNY